jgi:L-alanine-DL-glutamate epimerase-like enolase superfamily enzyme
LIWLRQKLDIPIVATETTSSMFQIPEYIVRRAADMIRCDTWLSGGITPTKKIADLCSAFGMMCEIHVSWFPTSTVANLHVECATKNTEFHEMLWPWFDYFIKEYPVLDKEGYLHVPQKPGLGIEIDNKALGRPIEQF